METLRFSLRNFAKVREADIVLDGITVIVGENNSGKSTVGKALYSLCSVLRNLDERVHSSKLLSVDEAYRNAGLFLPFDLSDKTKVRMLSEHLTADKVYDVICKGSRVVIRDHLLPKSMKSMFQSQLESFADELDKIRKIPQNQYRDAVVWDYFDSVFHSQVLPVFKNVGKTSLEILNGEHIKVMFASSSASVAECAIPGFRVCYINGPTALNLLNSNSRLDALEVYDRELTEELRQLADSSVAGWVGARKVANRARMKKLRDVLNTVLPGDVKNKKRGKDKLSVALPGAQEPICFENLSSGLKSFVLIWQILDHGLVSEGDVLILDEPEVRMHPEWQIVYAELIALLCKIFNLRVLLTSHSVDFIHALKLFVRKYKLTQQLNLYKSSINANGSADLKLVEKKDWDKLFDSFVKAIDILSRIQGELPEESDGES